ncbi:MAG: CDP-diacylglycerol--glycerol-3-phosphate 3-phosphatidyltransferase [Dermatophilaceae bacterium]
MSTAPARRVSNWNLPNALTVGRILLVPVYGWLLLRDGGTDPVWRWWAASIFLVAIVTDRIDGDLARAWNLITNFGKIADPIADKALTGMAFVGLSIIGDLPWWITIVVLVREWGITLLRLVVIRHGVIPAGRGGKLKTTLQSIGLGLFSLPLWTFPLESVWRAVTWSVLIVSVVVTVVTGIDYVIKALTLRQTSPRAQMKRERRAALAAAKAAERAREAADRAREATARAREAVERARGVAGDRAREAADRAREAADRAREAADRARDAADRARAVRRAGRAVAGTGDESGPDAGSGTPGSGAGAAR